MQKITLSAERTLSQRTRQRAEAENTTINAEFRRWLAQYAERPRSIADFEALMNSFNYVQPGKTYTRSELNES